MRILLLALFISGCASLVNQELNPDVFYKRDIQLEINGVKFLGVAVPKRADKYEIKIKARGKIDMLTVTSCHREFVIEDPTVMPGTSRSFSFTYVPIKGIEDGRGCLLDIGAFEKKRGRHSWATIDFETETENLPAILKCNGEKWDTNPSSVSICQGKTGLIQKIRFDHRVKVSPDTEMCNVMKTEDEMTYTYVMPRGECTYYFGDKYGNFHRHTTIGYESILIREVGE